MTIPFPSNPTAGDIYVDLATQITYTFNGTRWVYNLARIDVPITTSLNQYATATGTVLLPKGCIIISVEVNKPGWFRLYNSNAAMTADATRLQNVPPRTAAGVIVDPVFLTAETIDFEPVALAINRETPVTTTYPYKITNQGASGSYTITITHLPIQYSA